jgi:hypothetical protein
VICIIVTTAKGFKLLKQARLVSERIFYDNDGRGWVVQFVDRPLVGKQQEEQLPSSNPGSPKALEVESSQKTITSPTPSTRDSPSPTPNQETGKVNRRNRYRSGYHYGTTPYREIRRRNRSRPQLTLPVVLQRFPGVSQKLEQLIMGFNDEAMFKGSLDEIRVSVDRLLTDSVGVMQHTRGARLAVGITWSS